APRPRLPARVGALRLAPGRAVGALAAARLPPLPAAPLRPRPLRSGRRRRSPPRIPMSQATVLPAHGHAHDPAPGAAHGHAHDEPAHHHPIFDYDSGPPVDRGKFAIWLFLATEVMFFTGLIGTYLVLRIGTRSWPNPEQRLAVGVTAANTFLLITS